MKPPAQLVDDALEIIARSIYWKNEKTGETFQGITETDLYEILRRRGWHLAGGSSLWSYMTDGGFRALQPYKDGDLRPIVKGRRKLSPYNTLYTV